MSDSQQESLNRVLNTLARRLFDARDQGEEKAGVVVVLGAGCSIQYGLPSFVDLLRFAYEDLNPKETLNLDWRLESLRDQLEHHWLAAKPAELRKLLERYLKRIDGKWCTAYLRLARLAADGYIRAIVNMNFDTLLEEAFDERPKIQNSFVIKPDASRPVIIKPHGSLGKRDGVPILDLARSDLFNDQTEIDAASRLFRANDVVFLGYSGADAKIAAALRPQEPPRDGVELDEENYNQIFVFNVARPDPRLLKIMVDRQSTGLLLIGREASFENVMQHLSIALDRHKATRNVWESIDVKGACEATASRSNKADQEDEPLNEIYASSNADHFTRSELQALEKCRELAIRLRSRLNIAEGGVISIEQHAGELFRLCLKLARSSGNGLTTPEKFLLYCAAYLHDLGYFWAHSSGRKQQKYGWQLLTTHGEDTEALLRKLPPPELETIIPATYQEAGESETIRLKQQFIEGLILLCRCHSNSPHRSQAGIDAKDISVPIGELRIPIRLDLAIALFIAAEELTQGHPFFPSPYSLEGQIISDQADDQKQRTGERELEDPVLDLYLRQKQREIGFKYRREAVIACLSLKPNEPVEDGRQVRSPTETGVLLAAMAHDAIQELNRISKVRQGWGIHLLCDFKLPVGDEEESDEECLQRIDSLMRAALAEQFQRRLGELEQAAIQSDFEVGLVASVVDLIALYTDPVYTRTGSSSSCKLEGHEVIRQALERLRRPEHHPLSQPRLLHRFMLICNGVAESGKRKGPGYETMQGHFQSSFNRIYRPAWRFCADKWLNGVDSLVMARAALDFGSSRFRDEVVNGLQDLLEDKLSCEWPRELREKWGRPDPSKDLDRWKTGKDEKWAYGHEGCTLCTSRLLFVYSVARRLLPSPELRERFRDRHGMSLNRAVGALLYYFIRKPAGDASWLGIEEQQRLAESEGYENRVLQSADYIAWAVRATVQALTVDAEVREATGKGWLDDECGVPLEEVHRLFAKLWGILCSVEPKPPNDAKPSKNPQSTKAYLLSERAEEPHSYIVGHVALACLGLLELWHEIRECKQEQPAWKGLWNLLDEHVGSFSTDSARNLRTSITDALGVLKERQLAQLSEFFVWPAYVFLASARAFEDPTPEKNEWEDTMVDLLEQCINSRVWIEVGEGRGSWGYNIENTQRIATSMATCWRYCFKHHERMAKKVAKVLGPLKAASPPPPASGTPRKPPVRPSPRGTAGRRTRSRR
jgi:hypothetical protein